MTIKSDAPYRKSNVAHAKHVRLRSPLTKEFKTKRGMRKKKPPGKGRRREKVQTRPSVGGRCRGRNQVDVRGRERGMAAGRADSGVELGGRPSTGSDE